MTFAHTMSLIWAVAVVVFLVVEGMTMGLASIWFALGAVAALICALLGAPLWLQFIWFVVISVVTLCVTRPLLKKYVNARVQATNADRAVGMTGKVTQAIDNIAATGTVSVGGKLWTARSADGTAIPEGTLVRVSRIEGVKLIVTAADVQEEARV